MSFAKEMVFFDLLIYAGFPHLLCLTTFASLEALAERFCLTCVCVYDLFKCYLVSLALPLSLSFSLIFIALHGLTFTCLTPSKCLNWPLSRCEDGYKGFIRLQLGWHLGWRCTCQLNLCRRERVYATLPA